MTSKANRWGPLLSGQPHEVGSLTSERVKPGQFIVAGNKNLHLNYLKFVFS